MRPGCINCPSCFCFFQQGSKRAAAAEVVSCHECNAQCASGLNYWAALEANEQQAFDRLEGEIE